MLQFEDAVTDKASVIGLADGGHTDAAHVKAKLGELGSGQLLIVGELVEPVTQDPPCSTPSLSRMGPIRHLSHST